MLTGYVSELNTDKMNPMGTVSSTSLPYTCTADCYGMFVLRPSGSGTVYWYPVVDGNTVYVVSQAGANVAIFFMARKGAVITEGAYSSTGISSRIMYVGAL